MRQDSTSENPGLLASQEMQEDSTYELIWVSALVTVKETLI